MTPTTEQLIAQIDNALNSTMQRGVGEAVVSFALATPDINTVQAVLAATEARTRRADTAVAIAAEGLEKIYRMGKGLTKPKNTPVDPTHLDALTEVYLESLLKWLPKAANNYTTDENILNHAAKVLRWMTQDEKSVAAEYIRAHWDNAMIQCKRAAPLTFKLVDYEYPDDKTVTPMGEFAFVLLLKYAQKSKDFDERVVFLASCLAPHNQQTDNARNLLMQELKQVSIAGQAAKILFHTPAGEAELHTAALEKWKSCTLLEPSAERFESATDLLVSKPSSLPTTLPMALDAAKECIDSGNAFPNMRPRLEMLGYNYPATKAVTDALIQRLPKREPPPSGMSLQDFLKPKP